MKAGIIATLILSLSATTLDAWDEPSGFRDIPWGSSFAVVRQRLPELTCETQWTESPSAPTCRGDLMINDIRVFTYILFDSGGMDAVSFLFPEKSFAAMKALFIAQYGPPHTQTAPIVHDRMGAPFVNETLAWHGAQVDIHLERYATQLTYSNAVLVTKAHARVHQERARQKAPEGRKGW